MTKLTKEQEALLDGLHFLTTPGFRRTVEIAGIIDWEEIALQFLELFAPGIVPTENVESLPPYAKDKSPSPNSNITPLPTTGIFTDKNVQPWGMGGDLPKQAEVNRMCLHFTTIREDIESLKDEGYAKDSAYGRLLAIVDRLEKERPQFVQYPTPYVAPYGPPTYPIYPSVPSVPNPNGSWPDYPKPYVGDVFPDPNKTICRRDGFAVASVQNGSIPIQKSDAVADATGSSEDIPF